MTQQDGYPGDHVKECPHLVAMIMDAEGRLSDKYLQKMGIEDINFKTINSVEKLKDKVEGCGSN